MKHQASKILLSFLLIATCHIHSMDDDIFERPRRDIEYAYIPNHGLLFTFAETILGDLLKREKSNVPESDFEDARKIIIWVGAHLHDVATNHALPYVPKKTLCKVLGRLYELKYLYSSKSSMYTKDHFIGDAQANPEGLRGYFHKEIYFSSPRGPNGMDDSTSERLRRDIEYAYIPNPSRLLTSAERVRDSILKKGITNVPESDFEDAQKICIWVTAHNHDVTTKRETPHVPKAMLTKILNRLYQLMDIYCPGEPFNTKESFIGDGQVNHLGLKGYFHQEINFSAPRGPRGSGNNVTDQLLNLVQKRVVIAGGVVVAAAAVWYWFSYQHEPKTPAEDNNTDGDNQPEIIENTK